jgi:hypothetical protein
MKEIDDPEVLALTSPEFADVRLDLGMARAEFAAEAAIRQTAELWSSTADVLDDAARHPEVFIDQRAQLSESERREYAVRSAAADLAVRLSVAENTVRTWGSNAQALRASVRRLWAAFREGGVSVANARTVAEALAELPPTSWHAFEDAVLTAAGRLAPARFRPLARAARERVHEESIERRHRRAAEGRRFSIDDQIDGMSWLSVYLPSVTAHRAAAGIDAAARSLQGSGEARTLDQLRADVVGDLLTSGPVDAGVGVGVSLSVTVPVLTLLESSDEPGILHGVGPIDAETARRLAAEAPSFSRILTHPITGAVLELDRAQYRVPADLRRALAHRDRTCRFAGCGRPAARCDIDHVHEWQDGGMTDAANLIHLCRHHHRLKSIAKWRVELPRAGAEVNWTSPTGIEVQTEPPPF